VLEKNEAFFFPGLNSGALELIVMLLLPDHEIFLAASQRDKCLGLSSMAKTDVGEAWAVD
jgi:hypothetical protein